MTNEKEIVDKLIKELKRFRKEFNGNEVYIKQAKERFKKRVMINFIEKLDNKYKTKLYSVLEIK